MPELCRTCDRRAQDFGGCRCQAFLLAHDAAATDPVCSKSPQRSLVDSILADIIPNPAPTLSVGDGGEGSAAVSIAPTLVSAPPPSDWLYRPNPK